MSFHRRMARALMHPDQMHQVFSEETITVWCDFAEREAGTNYDGATHFCQFCGSTEHERITA